MKIVPLPDKVVNIFACWSSKLAFKLVFKLKTRPISLPASAEVRKGLYNTSLSAPKFFLKYTAWLAALKTLGAWGVFIISILDSAAFGVPMDPLVAGYVYANPHKAWLYCLAGSIGSALGSLVPYGLGRAGGELFLLKRIDEAKLQAHS